MDKRYEGFLVCSCGYVISKIDAFSMSWKWTCPDCGAIWSMMFNGKVTEMVKGKQNEKK